MFRGTRLAPIRYADPWDETLEARLAALTRPGAKRRVAYLYEQPDATTFRYRVYNMIAALRGDPDIAAAWFADYEIDRLLPLLDRCDSIVVCRVRYNERIGRLLARAHALGVATVFDVDDLVFDTDYVHLLVDTLALPITPETWDGWFAIVGRTGATLRLCDRVITTNRFLAEKITEFTPGKPVAVIPNFLNAEQLAICERMLGQKQRYGYAVDPPIYLGYFSGTPTHAHDFAILVDALARLLAADKRLALRLVGHVAPPPKLARFAERIERYPLQDFPNLQRLIGQTELNLVPLQQNAFTNCKSELKYFEAAAIGTATIASPTFAFRQAIEDGVNGWLATAPYWEERIGVALADWGRYREIAEAAVRHAWATYTPEAMAPLVKSVLLRNATAEKTAEARPSAFLP